MAGFTNKFVDVGTTKKNDELLVKRLIELISNDTAARNHPFAVDKQGKQKAGTDLLNIKTIYLPAFLLSVWQYIVTFSKDNLLGKETIDAWHPGEKEKKAKGKFNKTYGSKIKQDILITFDQPNNLSPPNEPFEFANEITPDISHFNIADIDEADLLDEVGNKCRIPGCGYPLSRFENGKKRKHYDVIKILYKPIDATVFTTSNPANNDYIALCREHAEVYKNVPGDKAVELRNIKNQWQMRRDAKSRLANVNLDSEIRHLLTRFDSVRRGAPADDNFEVVEPKDKITDTQSALFEEIKGHVSLYFPMIDSVIKQVEREIRSFSASSLSAQVGLAFNDINRADFSQEEIFNQLANWLCEQTDSTDPTICRIVISYYVRLCPVFKPIAVNAEVAHEPS